MVGGNSSDLSKVKTVQHSRDLKSCSIEVPCTHCTFAQASCFHPLPSEFCSKSLLTLLPYYEGLHLSSGAYLFLPNIK